MMNTRRCANRDVEQLSSGALGLFRSKRFATAGAWDKRSLTWSVREFPPRDSATTLTDAQILQVIREAFRVSSSHPKIFCYQPMTGTHGEKMTILAVGEATAALLWEKTLRT